MVSTTAGNGPTNIINSEVEETKEAPKKIHLNIAARAVRPLVMSNANQVYKTENQAPVKKPQA
jgi:hypothetical protein